MKRIVLSIIGLIGIASLSYGIYEILTFPYMYGLNLPAHLAAFSHFGELEIAKPNLLISTILVSSICFSIIATSIMYNKKVTI